MINFPPPTIPPASRSRSTRKTKRSAYVAEPVKEQEQKPYHQDRRSNNNRRHQNLAGQIMDRRTGQDRRKGRINVVI